MTKIFGFVLPGTEPEFDLINQPLAEPELEPFPIPGYLEFENFETLDLRPSCCRIIPRRVLSGSDDSVAGPSERRVFSSPAAAVNPPAEVDPPAAVNPPEAEHIMPEVLRDRIVNQMGGYGVRFVIKKDLYPTDTKPDENRFSMPEKKLSPEGMSFLTETEEEETRRRRNGNGDKGPIVGMTVRLITPGGDLTTVALKQWDYKFSKSFVFTGNWKNIVAEENLHPGQSIRVWFFRNRNDEPCFAMINP